MPISSVLQAPMSLSRRLDGELSLRIQSYEPERGCRLPASASDKLEHAWPANWRQALR
eukprot:CAMPEP_0168499134 /NCGR_PEP_ID=MMETSP0228-20121227/73625_1 /TAXON_ID=133427 /ORGANISM="Protoceratium reticulatum, Strain CCCM 535 (=CCMP 1889)" /LENGTH=57 /DNA_ID=CAMNT_0008516033 /DNA_START=75 /DNA_END=245 /DNA_ORIENTATION=-